MMDSTSLEAKLAEMAPLFRKGAIPFLIVASIITAGLMANLVVSPPTFKTDLSDFAPDSSIGDAHDRIHQHFPDETRPLFIHVTSDDGSNVLSIENLKQMNSDLAALKEYSSNNRDSIVVWTTAPGIIQIGLDEEANGTSLASIDNWGQLVDLILEEDTECRLTSDDQLLSAATYASSALLHKDLDFSATCEYLSDGTGDAAPTASSTLWVLEVDPDMEEMERKVLQDQFRDEFAKLSESSNLNYGVVSLDLISHDIDQGTFDNLAFLILIAIVVVIILLALAFKSLRGVTFPLIGLSSALIWTYGVLNITGAHFTALEVAVAPLVLGLGIDYAIHLQRTFKALKETISDSAEAWARACGRLSIPLSLAVVTTVAAFLANMISPLPPLATFGLALAIGVICAFLSATLVVGALHICFDKPSKAPRNPVKLPRLVDMMMSIQKKQQVAVLLIAIVISGASIFGAGTLETDFDLADFVDDDMEIMTVRDDLTTSYDSAGWKLVYILMEPAEGSDSIPDDSVLLDQLRGLHADLKVNHDVVGTDERVPSPAYEGPYVVLRDAILRNSSFGQQYNLEVFDGSVYTIDQGQGVELAAVFKDLSQNQSVADVLSGETWSQRISQTVHLDGDEIVHLRTEVRVEATTSAQASRVIKDFDAMLGSESESGTLRASLDSHAKLYVTGDLVTLQNVLDGLSISQVESTLISLVVSSIVLIVLTRRALPAVIVLFPVGLASLWVVGSMAALGLKWNVLTVMVTALTLGIGIDYAIHMWRRIEVELEKTPDHWVALKAALSTTGVALILSALTTAFGFLVLLFSPMPVIQDFGLVTAVTVVFSLVLSLMLLPVLVELAARGKEAKEINS